ncbi:hypothetical protein ES705_11252 [subsurface metagenome]
MNRDFTSFAMTALCCYRKIRRKMRKVSVLAVILFFLFYGTIFAAEGDVVWTRTHNGIANGFDVGSGIAVDGNGNVYVTGYETVTGQESNIWVRKYSSDGYEIWTRTYNGTANDDDEGYGIAVDGDGNVYVAGYETVKKEKSNIWVRKYDTNGSEVWTRTYNGTANGHDRGRSIAVDGIGNVYVTGCEWVGKEEKRNIWVRKCNSDGNVVWTKTYNGAANSQDRGYAVAVDASGNVYVTGYETVKKEKSNIWVRKYDSDGYELWTSTHNGTANSHDRGRGIAVDVSGNIFVIGSEWVTGEKRNIWLRKYDSDGNVVWTRTYNGTDNDDDLGYGIAVDGSGNVYVTGCEIITGEGTNIWVRKYDTDGNIVWTRTYNGPANDDDEGYGIAVDGSGNVYVAGYEYVIGEEDNLWVRKYACPFTIITDSLPEATVGYRYREKLSSSGGTPPINWTVSSGSLPSDLSLGSDGVISGTPIEIGNYSFTVEAVEKFGAREEKPLSLRVKEIAEMPGGVAGNVKIQGGEKGYVNPRKGEVAKIHFWPSGSGRVNVKIYTLNGLLVWEKSKSVSGAQDFIEWNCRNKDNDVVASGIYVVYVKGPGIKATKKVAILK